MPGSTTRRSTRAGFTLLEMIVVIAIGGVLTSIAILAFSQVQGQLATRSAQNNFLSLHAQARAVAVERGVPVQLVIDAGGDEVRIEWTGPDGLEVLNRLNLGQEFDVNVTIPSGSTTSPARVCFTARGIANPGCGTVTEITRVRLQRGAGDQGIREVEILPLGQARAL